MLEVAFLSGHILGFRSGREQRMLVEMVTTRAAAALGITDVGLEPGRLADFCIHGAERVVDLLRDHAPPLAVYRRGALIAETDPPVTRWHTADQ